MNKDHFPIIGPFLFEVRDKSENGSVIKRTFEMNKLSGIVNAPVNFVQFENIFIPKSGIINGLDFQAPPFSQAKLISCISGSILYIAVDVRKHSSTYGKHISVLLHHQKYQFLWIPAGFLQGFEALMDDTSVNIASTEYDTDNQHYRVAWNDQTLNIDWLKDLQEEDETIEKDGYLDFQTFENLIVR